MADSPASPMEILLGRRSLSSIPYTKCDTRIVDLKSLEVPEQATDHGYRNIYHSYIQLAPTNTNALDLRDAIESIKYGIAPPVAFPTETVYGLGSDATNEPAVAGIFAAKGRPSDNPLIVHVSSLEHLERVVDAPMPDIYKPVVEKFWPGPLTILLPVSSSTKFAKNVYPGQKTIGFRMPSSKYARFFIAACDRPIAGPSANSSGKPSPTTAYHVLDDLRGKINFILDGGACQVGVESTVVDGLHDPPLILRPGGVSREELQALGGKWADIGIGYDTHSPSHPSSPASDETEKSTRSENGYAVEMNGAPRAPGMKYKHYSPTARLILFTPQAQKNGRVQQTLNTLPKPPNKTGRIVIGFISRTWGQWGSVDLPWDGTDMQNILRQKPDIESLKTYWESMSCTHIATHVVYDVSIGATPVDGTTIELAYHLFGVLRLFDDLGCDYIFSETVERREGVGEDQRVMEAVADRLGKAASEVVEE